MNSIVRLVARARRLGPSSRSLVLVASFLVALTWTSSVTAQVGQLQTRVVVDRTYAAVVQIRAPLGIDHLGRPSVGFGSGTVISPAGYVLTNQHVVGDRSGGGANIEVWRQDGPFSPLYHAFNATLVRADAHLDLAVLRIVSDANGEPVTGDFAFFPIGDFLALDVKITDPIDAVGFPAAGGESITQYPGTVSGFMGEFDWQALIRLSQEGEDEEAAAVVARIPAGDAWIKTTAPFTPGISGGALLDGDGNLIGVPTFRLGELRLARPAILAAPLLEGVAGVVIARDGAPGSDPRPDGLVVAVTLSGLERDDSIGGMPFVLRNMLSDVARFEDLLREHSTEASTIRNCDELGGAAFTLERLRQGLIDLRRAQVRAQSELSEREAQASPANATREHVSAADQEARFVDLLDTHHGVITDLASANGALADLAARLHAGPPAYRECGFARDVANVSELLVLVTREQHALDARLRALRDVTRGERP